MFYGRRHNGGITPDLRYESVGRGFESLPSHQVKSHDRPLKIRCKSWDFLLYIAVKMAGKCDKNATNSGKTCFVRQCASLFCMPCLYHTAVLWATICPCYGLGV